MRVPYCVDCGRLESYGRRFGHRCSRAPGKPRFYVVAGEDSTDVWAPAGAPPMGAFGAVGRKRGEAVAAVVAIAIMVNAIKMADCR